jgi:hypothetical protein
MKSRSTALAIVTIVLSAACASRYAAPFSHVVGAASASIPEVERRSTHRPLTAAICGTGARAAGRFRCATAIKCGELAAAPRRPEQSAPTCGFDSPDPLSNGRGRCPRFLLEKNPTKGSAFGPRFPRQPPTFPIGELGTDARYPLNRHVSLFVPQGNDLCAPSSLTVSPGAPQAIGLSRCARRWNAGFACNGVHVGSIRNHAGVMGDPGVWTARSMATTALSVCPSNMNARARCSCS